MTRAERRLQAACDSYLLLERLLAETPSAGTEPPLLGLQISAVEELIAACRPLANAAPASAA